MSSNKSTYGEVQVSGWLILGGMILVFIGVILILAVLEKSKARVEKIPPSTINSTVKTTTPKHDYHVYMEITEDSIYIVNKQNDTIYKEPMNWKKPTNLQKSLIKDNL